MNWINVKDRLPVTQEGSPTYDWVLVTDGYVWTIARYTLTGWDFYDSNDEITLGPYAHDGLRSIAMEDIKYWLNIWNDLPE